MALREVAQVDRISWGGLSEADTTNRARTELAAHSGEVVLLVNQPQSSTFEAAALDAARATRPDVVIIYLGWPAAGRPQVSRALLTFGTSRANAQAAARILRRR